MGQTYKPNLGLNTDLVVKLLGLLAKNIQSAEDIKTQFDLVVFGSFVACSCVLSLRGSEGAMINLTAIGKYRNFDKNCIIVVLKGKIKGESNERDHLFYSVNATSSGVKMKAWIDLLLSVQDKAGRTGGPGLGWKFFKSLRTR